MRPRKSPHHPVDGSDGRKFEIRKDFYKGGWNIYNATDPSHIYKWSDERFTTIKEAKEYIGRHG